GCAAYSRTGRPGRSSVPSAWRVSIPARVPASPQAAPLHASPAAAAAPADDRPMPPAARPADTRRPAPDNPAGRSRPCVHAPGSATPPARSRPLPAAALQPERPPPGRRAARRSRTPDRNRAADRAVPRTTASVPHAATGRETHRPPPAPATTAQRSAAAARAPPPPHASQSRWHRRAAPMAAADPADNRAARVTTAGSVQPATAPENSSVFTFFERGVEPREVGVPVKGRTGVGLASRGNMLVPGNTLRRDQRIGPSQGPGQPHQAVILGGGIGQLVGALQLDADGKVIAVVTPGKS